MMINGRSCGRDAGKGGRGLGIAVVETGAEQEYMDEDAGHGGRGGIIGSILGGTIWGNLWGNLG